MYIHMHHCRRPDSVPHHFADGISHRASNSGADIRRLLQHAHSFCCADAVAHANSVRRTDTVPDSYPHTDALAVSDVDSHTRTDALAHAHPDYHEPRDKGTAY